VSDERAEIIRMQRNSVLSTLLACYPGGMQGKPLYHIMLSLFPEYTRTLAVKDLYYLEEKKYVARKNRFGKPDCTCDWKNAKWALTAAGNEVANNLVNDPALEV